LKKFLFVLFVAAVVSTGCRKESSTGKISSADLSVINGQLMGTWVFPMDAQRVVDNTGKLLTAQYTAAPALQFEANSKVKILQNTSTTLNGTYSLSAKDGFIYLDVVYPDGTDINYQVLYVDAQTLKLVSNQPYVYYNQTNPVPASAVSNVVLKKQDAADITGRIIKVVVVGTSTYNVSVYVTHTRAIAPADTAILMDTKANTTGTYTFSFPTLSGDKLTVDIGGDYTKVSFYAYYDGVPMAGNVGYDFGEIKTTTGWTTP
jgi:hypothetical protein